MNDLSFRARGILRMYTLLMVADSKGEKLAWNQRG